MARHRDANLDCKIYVGDLPRDANEKELERAFGYYGSLRSVWIARNPAGFAFIEFEDPRDADDAVRGLDGTTIGGNRVRVEHSTGKVRPKPWMGGGGGGGMSRSNYGPPQRRNESNNCYECGDRGHYAVDCPRRRRHSRRKSYSRSRSRERREGSRGGDRHSSSKYRERSASKSASKSASRSRSRSPRR